jgi:hypothetical protein
MASREFDVNPEKRSVMNEETQLQRAIHEALARIPGVLVWRCNSGGSRVKFGLRDIKGSVKGTPDLVGAVNGRLLLLEVKLPGKKPTKEQRERLEEARSNGAIAEVVRSVDEAVWTVKQAMKERTL